MDALTKYEFSFKNPFVPLTTAKAIVFIVILGFVVYFNGLYNNYVIDDFLLIVNNPLVHSLNNFFSFFKGGIFYSGSDTVLSGTYYRPALLIILSFIYTFFGSNFFWFHLFQLCFHIANSLVLFFVFKRYLSRSLALILSLVFLVHPINSETVLYISTMQDVLFFFFGILGFWLIVNCKSNKQLILAAFFLDLSIFSKETGFLFLFISIIYVFFNNRKLIFRILTLAFLIGIIYTFLRIIAVGTFRSPSVSPIENLNFIERLYNIPAIFFLYLKNFIFPLDISSSYQFAYKSINFMNFALPFLVDVLLILAFSFFGLILVRKYNSHIFGIYTIFAIWFILGILLHSQIFPLDSTAADRWFYFPIVGLLGMIGVLLDAIFDKRKKIIIAISILVILLLSAKTIIRSFDWRNDFILAVHDVKYSNDAYDLENRISIGYLKAGQYGAAKVHAERSINIFPNAGNYNNLGFIYLNLGDYKKANDVFYKSLKVGNFYATYEAISLTAVLEGENLAKNIEFTKNALEILPHDSNLWLFLSILEYKNGDIENAKSAITKAYSISPNVVTSEYLNKIINNLPLNSKFPLDKFN